MNTYNILRRLGITDDLLTKAYNRFVIVKNLLKYGDPFFIKGVTIETSTYCNRQCSYCPNSLYPPGKHFMERQTFNKIISDLSAIRFSGFINYHFYNEPLLDERLPSWIHYATRKVPKTFHRIYTNGDYLTLEVMEKFIEAGVSCFFVTNHSQFPDLFNAKMKPLLEKYPGYMRINPSLQTSYTNRGGLIKNGHSMSGRCQLYNNLQVTYEGDIVLCCNDFHRKHKMGNVLNESILEIWQRPQYMSAGANM